MSDLTQALTDILTDPERESLYSGSQLVAMLQERGVELPADKQEAWQLVNEARYDVEREAHS